MIRLENLSYKVYDEDLKQEKVILNDINIEFETGKITVITGHNGSGKSTLIKIIMGILAPTTGKVMYDNTDITDLSVSARANLGLTMAFQQPIKFKGLTVKDLLDVASSKSNNLSDACTYLSQVGLCAKEYIDRELDGTLSGGELKRIELAMALAKGGDVFLFDEPEAGIDLWSFDELVNIFKKLEGKTAIIVSHQNKILEVADNILLLKSDGYKMGTRDEMMCNIDSTKCSRLSEVSHE